MKKYLDPKNLPYFGAIVQAVLFSIAGQDFFPRAGWLVGLGVGAVVNYSIALASSRINDIAEKRKGLARLSLFCMLALSPATITLSLFMPASVFTAISWAVCVDLSIVLAGSITGKSMIATTTEVPKVTRKKKQETVKTPQEPVKDEKLARKHVKDDDLLAYLASNAGASHQQVADFFGVTRQAIGPRIKKLYEYEPVMKGKE